MCTGKETTLEDLALIIKRLLRCKSARGHGMRVWAWRIFTLAASRNDDDAHLYIYIVSGCNRSKSAVKHGEPRPGDIAKSVCDPTKARERLGFTASASVEAGLERTAEWIRGSLVH